MGQRRTYPQVVCQVGDSFSAASHHLVVSSRPWLKLRVLRKRNTIQRNWLPNFAAGCRKVLKTKRSFRKGLSLAETERKVLFKLLCVKTRNTSVCSVHETVTSMRKMTSRRMKKKLHLHTITSGLSNYLNWAVVSFRWNMRKINL